MRRVYIADSAVARVMFSWGRIADVGRGSALSNVYPAVPQPSATASDCFEYWDVEGDGCRVCRRQSPAVAVDLSLAPAIRSIEWRRGGGQWVDSGRELSASCRKGVRVLWRALQRCSPRHTLHG